MSGNKYLLDANIFIDAKNRYYRMSVCPGFWSALLAAHKSRRIFSIDKIHVELVNEQDEVSEWADGAPQSFFKKTEDAAVSNMFAKMVKWVNAEKQFMPAAKAEFASGPDGWLVAYAKINGFVLATQETYEPNARNRVKIPNVCVEFDVDYVDAFDMLEKLKAKFTLTPRRWRPR